MEWLKDYWLPRCFQIHLRLHEDDKGAMSLFLHGLPLLGYIQWDFGRFDDLLETIKAFDALTASHD
ncbi:hypothetical protein F4781DRAFT_415824 [Annulohypoxylon bovei var. microspora]|nr:hypothetical protein F4781DRAFT_415824 [Annulohypoxylon bovei var. microspora]